MLGENSHNEYGGCFLKVMHIEEKFAIKLPDGLPSEVVCPIICSGEQRALHDLFLGGIICLL